MARLADEIRQSARVADLRDDAAEVAALARRSPTVDLPLDGHGGRRRLMALLIRERRKTARLLAELMK